MALSLPPPWTTWRMGWVWWSSQLPPATKFFFDYEFENLWIDNSLEADPEAEALIEDWRFSVDLTRNTVLTNAAATYEVDDCYVGACELGTLISDAIFDYTNKIVPGCQALFINAGALQEDLSVGQVTYADINEMLPFEGEIVVVNMTGSLLMEAFEYFVTRAGDAWGGRPVLLGMRIQYELNSPSSSSGTLLHAHIVKDDVASVNTTNWDDFEPIDEEKTYCVIIDEFLLHGGDGYTMFDKAEVIYHDYYNSINSVVQDYVATFDMLDLTLRDNVVNKANDLCGWSESLPDGPCSDNGECVFSRCICSPQDSEYKNWDGVYCQIEIKRVGLVLPLFVNMSNSMVVNRPSFEAMYAVKRAIDSHNELTMANASLVTGDDDRPFLMKLAVRNVRLSTSNITAYNLTEYLCKDDISTTTDFLFEHADSFEVENPAIAAVESLFDAFDSRGVDAVMVGSVFRRLVFSVHDTVVRLIEEDATKTETPPVLSYELRLLLSSESKNAMPHLFRTASPVAYESNPLLETVKEAGRGVWDELAVIMINSTDYGDLYTPVDVPEWLDKFMDDPLTKLRVYVCRNCEETSKEESASSATVYTRQSVEDALEIVKELGFHVVMLLGGVLDSQRMLTAAYESGMLGYPYSWFLGSTICDSSLLRIRDIPLSALMGVGCVVPYLGTHRDEYRKTLEDYRQQECTFPKCETDECIPPGRELLETTPTDDAATRRHSRRLRNKADMCDAFFTVVEEGGWDVGGFSFAGVRDAGLLQSGGENDRLGVNSLAVSSEGDRRLLEEIESDELKVLRYLLDLSGAEECDCDLGTDDSGALLWAENEQATHCHNFLWSTECVCGGADPDRTSLTDSFLSTEPYAIDTIRILQEAFRNDIYSMTRMVADVSLQTGITSDLVRFDQTKARTSGQVFEVRNLVYDAVTGTLEARQVGYWADSAELCGTCFDDFSWVYSDGSSQAPPDRTEDGDDAGMSAQAIAASIAGSVVGAALLGAWQYTRILKKRLKTNWESKTWIIKGGELKFLEKLGSGAFGDVYSGMWRGGPVAIKRVTSTSEKLSAAEKENFMKELEVLSELRHPNVVLFMGACLEKQNTCLVTEYMTKGSLYEVLHSKTQLTWERRLQIALDAAKGMCFLHNSNPSILHRDLKSPNLLVDSDFRTKVSDFGLVTFQNRVKSSINTDTVLNGAMSVLWMAPEVLRAEPFTKKSDVYSFGIIFNEILTRQHPFGDLNLDQVRAGVLMRQLRPEKRKNLPAMTDELLDRLWAQEAGDRPTFDDVVVDLQDIIGFRPRTIKGESSRNTLNGQPIPPEMSLTWEIEPQEVTLQDKLGHGAFGVVYRGLWKGSSVAVKRLLESKVRDDMLRSFREEVALMASFRHPNIVLFMGACSTPPDLMLITELMPNGSVDSYLYDTRKSLSFSLVLRWATDAARGLTYLHSHSPPVMHRDMKSANMLLSADLTVKLSDFGLSRTKTSAQTMTSMLGTPVWMPPEVIMAQDYDEKCDVYSFGIVLWEMLARKIPFSSLRRHEILVGVASEGLRPPLNELIVPNTPQWFINLMQLCWLAEPPQRPSSQDVLRALEAENIRDVAGSDSFEQTASPIPSVSTLRLSSKSPRFSQRLMGKTPPPVTSHTNGSAEAEVTRSPAAAQSPSSNGAVASSDSFPVDDMSPSPAMSSPQQRPVRLPPLSDLSLETNEPNPDPPGVIRSDPALNED
eukprot:Rmarinus@m.7316